MHPKYVRMIKRFSEKSPRKKKGEPGWVVYILRCADQTFYIGITNNLDRRTKMHQEGKASRYTRTRGPVELVYHKKIGSRSKALVKEFELKKLSRKQKEKLVEKFNNSVLVKG